jgi:O-antigen ligase
MAADLYLIAFSFSRGIYLSLTIWLFLIFLNKPEQRGKIALSSFALLFGMLLVLLNNETAYSYIVSKSSENHEWGNGSLIDSILSGRLSLFGFAIEDFLKNPFLGTMFNGFELNGIERVRFGGAQAMSSPHNIFLTLLWKGGLLFFIPYMYGNLMLWRNVLKRKKNNYIVNYALFALMMGMGMFWDILFVINIGIFHYLILGAQYGKTPKIIRDGNSAFAEENELTIGKFER